MIDKDRIATYYSNARELIKQNNSKAARAYVLAILNCAVETYYHASTILMKAKTQAFLDKWIAVSRELYSKGITDYVLRCFGLPTKQEASLPKVTKKPASGQIRPQPAQPVPAAPSLRDGDIDISGLVDEAAQTQGWCAEVFDANRNAVVEIRVISSNREGSGTGFIISKNGYLLTNDHVVFDEDNGIYCSKAYMSFIGERKEYKIEVLFSDKKADVALCRFDANEVAPFTSVKTIEDYESVKQGADCLVIGNAFGQGLAPFTGIIRYTHDESGNLVYTAPSNPGDSGGPVFNRHGECIGINKSKTIEINGTAADAYANATPMDRIKGLLTKWAKHNNIEL